TYSFLFIATPPPAIYPLSLHDALPIWPDQNSCPHPSRLRQRLLPEQGIELGGSHELVQIDRFVRRVRDLRVAGTEENRRHAALGKEAAVAGLLVADRLGGQVQRPGHILGRAHQRR